MIITFFSTNLALMAEAALEAAGVDIDIVPPPQTAPAGCGLAIEFDSGKRQLVETVLLDRSIKYAGIYDSDGGSVV